MAGHPLNGPYLAAAILTCIFSIFSFIGATGIILTYWLLPGPRRHFRHALIINLAVADAINGLNNSVSGLWILAHRHDLRRGAACTANAYIGQMSVQATDLTILVIAVVTLVGITRTTLMPEPTQLAKWILCSSIWVLPIITASIAAGKHFFVPVNGNWCWIKEDPKYLRYALTHTWRFLTIVSCVFIYSFIYWYLSKNFRGLRNATTHHSSLDNGTYLAEQSTYRSAHGEHSQQAIVDPYRQVELRKSMEPPMGANGLHPSHAAFEPTREFKHTFNGSHPNNDPIAAREAQIKKTLLLNAYPIAYVVLWLPGIANRIAEATGHPTVVLLIMQSTTQLVGLANAITFGLNEQIMRQLRTRFGKRETRG